jgi:3-hydroxy-9,10-secoandrosta-1,3,5(10)-triene-9,17-dione monooxygenase reductase component
MGLMPTAVTVVTAMGTEGPVGATANAVTSLSLDPPLMLAALDRRSRTLEVILEARRFGVNVLAAGHERLARRFATKDPHDEKWAEVGWEAAGGSPRIDDALVFAGCELGDTHEGGDHVILVGAVLELNVTDGDPLVFHRATYGPLGRI